MKMQRFAICAAFVLALGNMIRPALWLSQRAGGVAWADDKANANAPDSDKELIEAQNKNSRAIAALFAAGDRSKQKFIESDEGKQLAAILKVAEARLAASKAEKKDDVPAREADVKAANDAYMGAMIHSGASDVEWLAAGEDLKTAHVALEAAEARHSKVDFSSPQAVALSFARSLEAGDVTTARVTSDGHVNLERAAKYYSAAHVYFQAGASKFPAAFVNARVSDFQPAKSLESVDVKIDGDTATVTPKDGNTAVLLRKVDGRWKVDTKTEIITETNRRPALAIAEAFREVAADINAGKYSRFDQAADDMEGHVLAAIKRVGR